MHTPPQRGFTLVETMVAVTVLAAALVGPYTAVQNALTGSRVARDQLTGSALAQEGLEYIRSIRDNNYLNNRTWMHQLSGYSCFSITTTLPTNHCVVDPSKGDPHTASPSTGAVAACSLASCQPLYVTPTGLYTQDSAAGTVSRFKRTIQMTTISSREVKVYVTVSWTTSGQAYSVTVTDNLQDWL